MKKFNILLINGSINGESGQSGVIAAKMMSSFDQLDIKHLVLKTNQTLESWEELVSWADGFIFLTGTYWDSWGSPLQSFLEKTTEWEASMRWLGKPASVIVTMHSVGGKSVLSRLQGVLGTMGLTIPPLTGMVYSLNTHLINQFSDHLSDFWSLSEIPLLIENLIIQLEMNKAYAPKWKTWEVDTADVKRSWLTLDDLKL